MKTSIKIISILLFFITSTFFAQGPCNLDEIKERLKDEEEHLVREHKREEEFVLGKHKDEEEHISMKKRSLRKLKSKL